MKGRGITITGDKKDIFKAAINAALQGEGIYIVDATRALEAQIVKLVKDITERDLFILN